MCSPRTPPPPNLPPQGGGGRNAAVIELPNAAATEAFGARIAPVLRRHDVIALHGDLGAGKTTLVRGILRGLGFEGEVASPTFPIVVPYEALPLPVWHVDLYRIERPGELEELALDEARADAVRLSLDRAPDGGRALTAQVPPAWGGRWPPR